MPYHRLDGNALELPGGYAAEKKPGKWRRPGTLFVTKLNATLERRFCYPPYLGGASDEGRAAFAVDFGRATPP